MRIWVGTSCSEWLALYSFGHGVGSADRPGGLLYQSGRPSLTLQIIRGADSLARLQMCVSIWDGVQKKPWMLSQAPNERSRELEVGWLELVHLDDPGRTFFFPPHPNATAEAKESALRSMCFSEMHCVTSTRLLSPEERGLTALLLGVGGSDEIMKCWTRYCTFNSIQLGNQWCQCKSANTPLLLRPLTARNMPKSVLIHLVLFISVAATQLRRFQAWLRHQRGLAGKHSAGSF